MKKGKVPHIAILIQTNLRWGGEIINGILAYAQEVGPWVIWVKTDAVGNFDQLPKGWSGDGVIANVSNPMLARQLEESGLPVVNVSDRVPSNYSVPSVLTDDEAGGWLAVEYFLGLGHRNIGYAGSGTWEVSIKYKDMIVKELSSQGRDCAVFVEADGDEEELQSNLLPWLRALPKPIGIFSCGATLSRMIVEACMQDGIAVPEEVAVLSSRDEPLICHSCFPPLSGLDAPLEQIGRIAAKKLHAMILGKKVTPEVTYIPPRGVVERLSTEMLAVDDPRMVQVLEFIREHAFEKVTMKDILRRVPMSRRSLERRFQQSFGRTPFDEIRRLRIERAKRLLVGTDQPMSEIAEACGYATYNYLAYAFKQGVGISPSSYRKQFGS